MKTLEQCCDEVAKKYPQVIIDDLDSPEAKVVAHLNRLHAEAAELYAAEVAREQLAANNEAHKSATRSLVKEAIDWFVRVRGGLLAAAILFIKI